MFAYLDEIFASFQGEGLFAGLPMTFVRFAGCSQSCTWCDTKHARAKRETARIEKIPGSSLFEEISNPVGLQLLIDSLQRFPSKYISITGGEPLEQATFLKGLLPFISSSHKILLETNGLMPAELETVIEQIDIISADVKLPSSGNSDLGLFGKFLGVASKKRAKIYVKAVVTQDTKPSEIGDAAKIISSVSPNIPFFIQPASIGAEKIGQNSSTLGLTSSQIESQNILIDTAKQNLTRVFFMPQLHKIWGQL